MGLGHVIARLATRAAKVLIVEVPGQWRMRVELEQQLVDRGWRQAWSPADADILAICGNLDAELANIVDNLWAEMPGPRSQLMLTSPGEIPTALDQTAQCLMEVQHQKHDAQQRAGQPVLPPSNDAEHDDAEHEHHHSHVEHDHDNMDHGAMGHGEHHDHSGMDMTVQGLPLAQGGDDRDGLEMDELHVPLGPVLPCWPAGFVLECTLQGDVVVDARSSMLGDDPQGPVLETQPAVRCDGIMALLTLTGAHDLAARARTARDSILASDLDTARHELEKLCRRVRKSRMLRWSLDDVLEISQSDQTSYRLPESTRGNAYDRLRSALEAAARDLTDDARSDQHLTVPWQTVPKLLIGSQLANVRLAVASLNLGALPITAEEGYV